MRRFLKRFAYLILLLPALPLVVLVRLEKGLSQSEGVFLFFAQALAFVPGMPGVYLRSAYYSLTLERCSWEVHVGFGSFFTHRGARLSRQVSTGAYCLIGHATLGEGTRLASRVSIPSGRRQHFDDSGVLSEETRFDRVTIGPGCWIGESAVVAADIGARSVVSAGAIVVKPLPSDCVAGGNPAAVIRQLGCPSKESD